MGKTHIPNPDRVRKAKAAALRTKYGKVTQTVTMPFIAPTIEGKKSLLHINAGPLNARQNCLHRRFQNDEWHVTRQDHNPAHKPEILAKLQDLSQVTDAQFDAIWLVHFLETLYAHEVLPALKGLRRILKPGGFLFMATPNAQRLGEILYRQSEMTVLYQNNGRDVSVRDLLFGNANDISKGDTSRVCHSCFTPNMLGQILRTAGFLGISIKCEHYNLWATAYHLAQETKQNAVVTITGNDVNEMMKQRDEMDVEPKKVTGLEQIKKLMEH